MEEINIVARIGKHAVKWSADEFAATDEGDFFVLECNVVAGEEPVDGGGSGGVEFGVLP